MPDSADISPLDMMIAQQLPGMGEHALPAPCDDAELDRLPVHTATRVRESDPARYALAVGLFFGERMSVRQICRFARMSPHTLSQIILEEMKGRTAEQWKDDLLERLKLGGTLAASALVGLLMDEDAVQIAGIKGVATAIREQAHAHELLSGRPTDRRETLTGASDEVAARAYLARMTNAAPIDSGAENGEASREGAAAGSVGEGEYVEVLHD